MRMNVPAVFLLTMNRGFSICRALALQHPTSCLAVHTANPSFIEPTWRRNHLNFFKYRIAKLTRAKVPFLSFGYLPTELQRPSNDRGSSEVAEDSLDLHKPKGATLHRLYALRPQTLAFSLCDSPVGLLAALLDVIHTRIPSQSPLTSRSRSPFLSPIELEMQGSNHHDDEERGSRPSQSSEVHANGHASGSRDMDIHSYAWTATEILNFTMLQWLPGPEAVSRSSIIYAEKGGYIDEQITDSWSLGIALAASRTHGQHCTKLECVLSRPTGY